MTAVGSFALLFTTCLASVLAFRAMTPNDKWIVSIGLALIAFSISLILWGLLYFGVDNTVTLILLLL